MHLCVYHIQRINMSEEFEPRTEGKERHYNVIVLHYAQSKIFWKSDDNRTKYI